MRVEPVDFLDRVADFRCGRVEFQPGDVAVGVCRGAACVRLLHLVGAHAIDNKGWGGVVDEEMLANVIKRNSGDVHGLELCGHGGKDVVGHLGGDAGGIEESGVGANGGGDSVGC